MFTTYYKISKAIFSKETVLKVVYLWQKDLNIKISEETDNYILSISAKEDTPLDWKNLDKNIIQINWDKFNEDLQEQQLRETLNSQFGELRNSIYNKAFEHFGT